MKLSLPIVLLSTTLGASSLTLPSLFSSRTTQITMTSQILSDLLPLTKRISIFASLTRDVDSVSSRLSSSGDNTTLLAPSNGAMSALPRKPWEDPEDYRAEGAQAYAGEDGQQRASGNLARFVAAHVVPSSPWKEGQKVRTLAGTEVWWEKDEGGERRVMPGRVEVEEIGSKAGNGEVWVLKAALNYASS
ncbi:hypothetical protein ANO11243_006660 [Dothideomycetidae sp. 11243]|nr:hypothetical protein ANO11243_006660 [fungal sp. No.11243]